LLGTKISSFQDIPGHVQLAIIIIIIIICTQDTKQTQTHTKKEENTLLCANKVNHNRS